MGDLGDPPRLEQATTFRHSDIERVACAHLRQLERISDYEKSEATREMLRRCAELGLPAADLATFITSELQFAAAPASVAS